MKGSLVFIQLIMNNKTDMKNFIIALAFLFSGIILISCKSPSAEEGTQQSVPVMIEQVKLEVVRPLVRSSGRLFTSSEQRLAFKTGGIVNRIYVSEGEKVSKGQLLAELKKDEILAMVSQANEVAEKARRDFRRVESLFRDTVATREQYENARTALLVAESQLEIAQFNLQYSSIRAPSDGKILRKLVENNEIVAPGYPLFLFGTSQGAWQLRVNVTDREIIHISVGDSATVGFDAYPSNQFSAFVTEKSAMADPYTGLFEVIIEILPSDFQLVAGFIGRVVIYAGKAGKLVSIPVEALVEARGNEGLVHLYDNGRPVRRTVEILRIEGDRILIGKGLTGDEMIITEGTSLIRPGSRLRSIER